MKTQHKKHAASMSVNGRKSASPGIDGIVPCTAIGDKSVGRFSQLLTGRGAAARRGWPRRSGARTHSNERWTVATDRIGDRHRERRRHGSLHGGSRRAVGRWRVRACSSRQRRTAAAAPDDDPGLAAPPARHRLALERAYALRDELDSTWASRPLALA